MKIDIDVPDEKIAYALCSAFEGGINYWAKRYETHCGDVTTAAKPWGDEYTPYYVSFPFTPGASVSIEVEEGDKKPRLLTRESLAAGLKVMAEKYPKHFGDLLSESNQDATTGDVLVQCAVFGEIVYG